MQRKSVGEKIKPLQYYGAGTFFYPFSTQRKSRAHGTGLTPTKKIFVSDFKVEGTTYIILRS